MNNIKLSIVIPCRNEEKLIGKCLDSILEQDYPKENLEILVADGMSTDKTRDILKDYASKYTFIRWIENPKKIASAALNIMIPQAKGEVIVRIDAHNKYPKDYVSKCVRYLDEYKADNVGGVCLTMPGTETIVAKAIALALSSGFGVGNSLFRIGVKEPTYVDTVPFGCYRREVFDKIGVFDEDLVRNQDDEFNARLIKHGGKILLVPDIISYYFARETYSKLWKMYYQYGYFKPLTVIKLKGVFTLRQIVPGLLVGSMIILFLIGLINKYVFFLFMAEVVIYIAANFIFSFLLAVKKTIRLLPFLMVAFAMVHFGYGIGYLKGIIDFMVFGKHKTNKIKDMPITR